MQLRAQGRRVDSFPMLLVALLVSSWITGVALHKLTQRRRRNNECRQEVGDWQPENIMYILRLRLPRA